ncbi:MAG: bifunctional riboflavin kinase/FAD synthetase [Candidatus Latescibacteria bacterium]|nr:bifunctional riboflavin kinase/FAD synthetase [Candidatus Latescibacterota bacterium]
MKIIEDINHCNEFGSDSVITVGAFDGVHLGHAAILRYLNNVSSQAGSPSAVVTFEPHPQEIVNPQGAVSLLTTKEEKLEAFASLGIETVFVLPFTAQLAELSPEEFVREILVDRLRTKRLVIGYNHTFGNGRSGNVEILQELGNKWGFRVNVVPPVIVGGRPVSSTRIRNLLSEGNVSEAAQLLGRNYGFCGLVYSGEGLGRRLGFPTANLRVKNARKLIPATGVYAVRAMFSTQRRAGVMNIGYRPSFEGTQQTIELYLLNFKGDLYNTKIKVELLSKIRDEMKFLRKEGLTKQIEEDIKVAEELTSDRKVRP